MKSEEKPTVTAEQEQLLKDMAKRLVKEARSSGEELVAASDRFVQELLSAHYNQLLEAEMDEHLGYEKGKRRVSENARNGKACKTVQSELGSFAVETPRDRDGSFEPQAISKRQTKIGNFADKILSLYARGMTTREIEEHLREMYGIDASSSFISRVTDDIKDLVTEWQNRPLERLYPVIFMDAIRFSVRDNGRVIKKAVYLCLGIDLEGKQDVLGMWIAENEGAKFWMNVCSELKGRGVEDILIACVDGLKGLPEAIEAVYPEAEVQLCIVHTIRYSTKFISFKDRRAFCKDLKEVYNAPTLEAAEQALEKLEEQWADKYPGSVRCWKDNWNRLSTFFRYPQELRKLIYTTNSIESLNSGLRKNTKNRKVFPSDDALFKILFLNIRNITKKWKHRWGWNTVVNQLMILFPERLSSNDVNV